MDLRPPLIDRLLDRAESFQSNKALINGEWYVAKSVNAYYAPTLPKLVMRLFHCLLILTGRAGAYCFAQDVYKRTKIGTFKMIVLLATTSIVLIAAFVAVCYGLAQVANGILYLHGRLPVSFQADTLGMIYSVTPFVLCSLVYLAVVLTSTKIRKHHYAVSRPVVKDQYVNCPGCGHRMVWDNGMDWFWVDAMPGEFETLELKKDSGFLPGNEVTVHVCPICERVIGMSAETDEATEVFINENSVEGIEL